MAALSPLELRLERLKRLGNARQKLLDLFCDGFGTAAYLDHYRDFRREIHIHFSAAGWMHCATFRAENLRESSVSGPFLMPHGIHADHEPVGSVGQFAVFIGVGNISQNGRPIASAVRLQPLDCCPMWPTDSDQIAISEPIETALEVAYRKLSASLDGAAVVLGEPINEVVQRSSEIVSDLTEQNPKDAIDIDYSGIGPDVVRFLRIEIDDSGIVVELAEAGLSSLEILDVLYCPIDPVERVLEWMSHGTSQNQSGGRKSTQDAEGPAEAACPDESRQA